ncbi:MAG: hypothetical protein GXC73_03110 [Chitinophagaceae bacterium]|nr:hypothetical protein [Chitinophagaceae bacterium]
MINIPGLANDVSNGLKLTDGNWQYAVVYDLNTNSVFWNRAACIVIRKDHAKDATSALIYLLQKESKSMALWEQQWGSDTPSLSDFLKYLAVWGRFSNTAGYTINIDAFWKSYAATIDGITAEPSFVYSKEGIATPYLPLLEKEKTVQVICFDDAWNEQNFFIETTDEWVLFNWVTMA